MNAIYEAAGKIVGIEPLGSVLNASREPSLTLYRSPVHKRLGLAHGTRAI
jgi:hypothetical protein